MPANDDRFVAEFFAGIGLMRLGLERAGWKVVYSNDIDENKYEIYAANFPDAPRHFVLEDIHRVSVNKIPDIQLATASFPCNDLSLAGAMAGLGGRHSSAFWGFIRVMREMGNRRPPLLLVENVLGFLSSKKGDDFEEAMLALNDLGYSVDPFVLDASWFVPQSRARLFVVAAMGEEQNSDVEISPLRPATLVNFIHKHPEIQWNINHLPSPRQTDLRLKDILEELPEDAPEWWSKTRAQYFFNQMSARHQAIAREMIRGNHYRYATAFRRIRNGKSMAELRSDGKAGCLRTPRGGSGRQILFKAGRGKYFVRLLSPRECARLMGAGEFKITVSLNQALFGFGDAVCVSAIEWIANKYLNVLANRIVYAPA